MFYEKNIELFHATRDIWVYRDFLSAHLRFNQLPIWGNRDLSEMVKKNYYCCSHRHRIHYSNCQYRQFSHALVVATIDVQGINFYCSTTFWGCGCLRPKRARTQRELIHQLTAWQKEHHRMNFDSKVAYINVTVAYVLFAVWLILCPTLYNRVFFWLLHTGFR